MEPMDRDDTVRRLKSIEGHVRGVARMVENDAYCIDMLRQLQAIQAALNKVSTRVLDDHIHSCLITAVRGEDQQERERVLKEIMEVYEMATKV
jgi:DNA-binding FrmR family transcriptional regulator